MMSKLILPFILIGFTCLLFGFTNPRIEVHKAAVREKVNALMQKNLKGNVEKTDGLGVASQALNVLFGSYIVDRVIDVGVTRSNYLLFSTTNFTYEGEAKVIGFGMLGSVFVSSKVDEVVKNAKP